MLTPAVTLNLSAFNPNPSDPVFEVRAANGFGPGGAWVPYVPNLPFTLLNVKGTRKVSVQYRNGAGAVSATFSHSIVLQQRPVAAHRRASMIHSNASAAPRSRRPGPPTRPTSSQ